MTSSSIQRAILTAALVGSLGSACSDGARIVTPPPEQAEDGLRPGDGDEPDGDEPDGDEPDGDQPDGAGGSDNSGAGGGPSSNGGSQAAPDEPLPDGTLPPAEMPPAQTSFTAPRGGCDVSVRAGGFKVEKQVDFGVVQGEVRDGVVPTAIPTVVDDDGRCRLLERRNLACFPACVGMETCGESGACIPFPRQVSVGEVSISGLTRDTVMSPLMPGNSYLSPGATNPPYGVESPIVLSASGQERIPAFQLFGIGSEPLGDALTWVLTPGSDLVLEWPAPTANVATTVLAELTIDQHGITPLSLSCELEDTGTATIPAAIVDRLIASGVTGFPNGRLTRRTADHVDLAIGCVDLVVGSPLAASISVSGFTPCDAPADCPSGQTCNIALERCE
jgi:hypothetical protein